MVEVVDVGYGFRSKIPRIQHQFTRTVSQIKSNQCISHKMKACRCGLLFYTAADLYHFDSHTTSRRLLKVSTEGASMTCLGRLFQRKGLCPCSFLRSFSSMYWEWTSHWPSSQRIDLGHRCWVGAWKWVFLWPVEVYEFDAVEGLLFLDFLLLCFFQMSLLAYYALNYPLFCMFSIYPLGTHFRPVVQRGKIGKFLEF